MTNMRSVILSYLFFGLVFLGGYAGAYFRDWPNLGPGTMVGSLLLIIFGPMLLFMED